MSGASGDRLSRIRAELATKEKEVLNAIKEDVCQWLNSVLTVDIAPDSFLEALDTGIVLCKLAAHIQKKAASLSDNGPNEAASKIPLDDVACNPKAEPKTFFARDNTANFIAWVRKLGVEESVIFESDGLVLHRDEKRVILCLLDVARFADKVGVTPPQLVQMEREIESLEEGGDATEVGKDESISELAVEQLTKTEVKGESGREEGGGSGKGSADLDPPDTKRFKGDREHEKGNNDGKRRSGGMKQTTPEPDRRKKAKKEESFDDQVGRILGQCSCGEKLQVTRCGKGKFILRGECLKKPGEKKVTLYARLLSDRIMVRVGGGWDTLEHLLLKLDPCRFNLSVTQSGGQASREILSVTLGKRRRED